ncbi:hypothetical protein HII31_03041, partial [Pseudocercospora fuligena]
MRTSCTHYGLITSIGATCGKHARAKAESTFHARLNLSSVMEMLDRAEKMLALRCATAQLADGLPMVWRPRSAAGFMTLTLTIFKVGESLQSLASVLIVGLKSTCGPMDRVSIRSIASLWDVASSSAMLIARIMMKNLLAKLDLRKGWANEPMRRLIALDASTHERSCSPTFI